jgi:predicted amidohydrolase
MAIANRITVTLAQLNSELGDSAMNLERAKEYIARAGKAGADLVMFPELYLQGYRADERFAGTAEPVPGPTTELLIKEARKHGLFIVMGMARLEEHYPWLVYNSLCFVGPEGLVGEGYYDKIHLGTFHPYIEGVYFAPGRKTPIFETPFGPVSLQICYDVWYPELTRTYAVSGSVLNLVISAGPSGRKKISSRQSTAMWWDSRRTFRSSGEARS